MNIAMKTSIFWRKWKTNHRGNEVNAFKNGGGGAAPVTAFAVTENSLQTERK
jgi:hypothetical protein